MPISFEHKRQTIQRSQSSFLHHAIFDIVTSSTNSASKSKKPLLETVYLFEIQLPNKLDNQTLPMSKHVIIDIFDGINMKRSAKNILTDLNQLVKQPYSSSQYCTAKMYKIEDKYYVILDWRNFLFFGDIAVVSDFCRSYDTFRWSYIRSLLQSVNDKIYYEKVGSNSCVSDIDISICPKINFSSYNGNYQTFRFKKYANKVKKAFEIIMKLHNKHFTQTFEDLFDTNIYATNFTIKADITQFYHVRQILSDKIFHYYRKKEHVICFPKIHETILTSNEIEKIHLSQFTFAFRRLFNHLLSHPNPKLRNAMNFYYRLNYNNKDLLKGILGDVDLLKYYIYSEVDNNKLIKDYTKYVTKYYKTIDAIVANEKVVDTSSLVKDALKYLSIATCMEHDSYHSYGAFLDIVILSGGESNKKQYMHSYLFKHSIVDNVGFISDIITRYKDDYCYDDVTNILKVSKYIERICNAILNSGDKYNKKRINDIRTIASRANEARKNGIKEEKSQMAIEVYKIFTSQGDTHINIDDFLEAVLLEFDNYLSL